MLEQAGLVRRGFDEGRLMRIEVPAAPDDARERVEALLDRAALVAESRADRVVGFAETRVCRHEQVAAHFGEEFVGPCGACDVCVPTTRGAESISSPPPPLPEDIGEAIVDAVASLTLAAGSTEPRRDAARLVEGAAVCASLRRVPTARGRHRRRRSAMGATRRELGRARRGDDPRWLQVLHVDRSVEPPRIRTSGAVDVDEELVTRLRSWRLERSQEDAVPAYVVLHDATLRELAALRPQTRDELAGVKGFGPVKLDRYGDDLLAVLSASA